MFGISIYIYIYLNEYLSNMCTDLLLFYFMRENSLSLLLHSLFFLFFFVFFSALPIYFSPYLPSVLPNSLDPQLI